MVFSEESCRAFFEMVIVELIELEKVLYWMSIMSASRIWGYIYLWGKLIRPNKDVMSRIKEAFEALKVPYYRTSSIVTRGGGCGPNPWQKHHHKARDALRSAAKGERTCTSIWDTWQHDEIYRKSQFWHNWSDAWVRYFGSHRAVRHKPQCRAMAQRKVWNLIHLQSLDSNKQAGRLWKMWEGRSRQKCQSPH